MGEEKQPDFERLYYTLAGRVADAIDILVDAMRECEDMYVREGHQSGALSIVPPSSHEEK